MDTTDALPKLVADFLKKNPNEKFTARQISEFIFTNYPKKMQVKLNNSKSLSTDEELKTQLVAEIGRNKNSLVKNYNIKYTETRPREYYYSNKSDESINLQAVKEVKDSLGIKQQTKDSNKKAEEELYKLVCNYLKAEHNVYAKRINEKTSSNKFKGNNIWLHPDIVGVQDLSCNFENEVTNCAHNFYSKKVKLWSLEVKLDLTLNNLREYFFQAVANSSWANKSYLVAINIKTNSDSSKILAELELLSNLYGVGIMELNVDNPTESEIIYQAKDKDDVDWGMVNRIYEVNNDFKKYVTLINNFYKLGNIDSRDWDFDKVFA